MGFKTRPNMARVMVMDMVTVMEVQLIPMGIKMMTTQNPFLKE